MTDSSFNDTERIKIEKIISLLSIILTLDDKEIIFLSIEEAIDMLKDLGSVQYQ